MKKILKGFTLAEVLLCLAIIGVVTAMGVTIANKSTQRAYNMFWRVGYENLYNVLAEVGAQDSINDLRVELYKIFRNDNDEANVNANANAYLAANNNVIAASNNIRYEVVAANIATNPKAFYVRMTVPQPKTRQNQNGEAFTWLLYTPEGDGHLIPLPALTDGAISLQDRQDLLPFYIDDGVTGRVLKDNSGLDTFKNGAQDNVITLDSYQALACKRYGTLSVTIPSLANEESAYLPRNYYPFELIHFYAEGEDGDETEVESEETSDDAQGGEEALAPTFNWGFNQIDLNADSGTQTSVLQCSSSPSRTDGVVKLYKGRR